MKILCISDATDPLVYSENIVSRYGDVDLIIAAGDLNLKYYEFIISSLNKPLFFVFGNHNLEHIGHFIKNDSSSYSPLGERSISSSPAVGSSSTARSSATARAASSSQDSAARSGTTTALISSPSARCSPGC